MNNTANKEKFLAMLVKKNNLDNKKALQKFLSLFIENFLSGCGSVWLECSVRDAEAARSNRAIPTSEFKRLR